MKPYQTVIDIIRDLAKMSPDRTSQDRYFNFDDGKTPECIFGHALTILGVSLVREPSGSFVIHSPEGVTIAKGYQAASVVDWAGLGIEPPSEDEAVWSDRAQSKQDNGATWGDAVRYADEIL